MDDLLADALDRTACPPGPCKQHELNVFQKAERSMHRAVSQLKSKRHGSGEVWSFGNSL